MIALANSPARAKNRPCQQHCQPCMPRRNFVVATARLVTVTFCFHNSSLPCFVLNEIFDMLQQQELYIADEQIMNRTCNSESARAITRGNKGARAN